MDAIFFILELIFDLLNVFSLVYEVGSHVEENNEWGRTVTLILFLILFFYVLVSGILVLMGGVLWCVPLGC